MSQLTPRQILMAQLIEECRSSKIADIQRAVLFLQRARDVRAGCRVQRNASKEAQATAWKKKVDDSITW